MKNLILIFIFLSSFLNYECTSDTENIEVGSQSLINEIGPEDNIKFAEKVVGKLLKKEIKYLDEKSGSEFILVFAAKTEKNLQDFFNENEIIVKGIALKQKYDFFNSKRPKLSNIALGNVKSNSDIKFAENEVFYDLISKKLKKEDIGFSFTIKPKQSKLSLLNSKNLRPNSVSWRQQTSLPWCEAATIYMNTESSPSNYYLYRQSRGIFWSGSGSPDGIVTSDGSIYDTGVDGPKYTRFGGDDPVAYVINYITWYDFESNSQENGSILN